MKQIPYTFDCISVSPLNPISNDAANNIGRLKVGVFTRYGNRNGSYITDQYAESLIESAINKPVIGFFDRESGDWQGHTGPTLANAYGYVEAFQEWQPFTDADGKEREYAVFSVVLFSDYFEEARHILGKSQSMELDPLSIQGDWAEIDGEEYFVYTAGKMLGFCILGDSKEPCFSASSFFEKDAEKTQFEKFSSLLFDLRTKVEETEKSNKGGEQPMEEMNIVETPVVKEEVAATEMEVAEEFPVVEEPATEMEAEENVEEEEVSVNEYETKYNELLDNFNSLQSTIDELNGRIEEFENQINTLNEANQSLQSKIDEANETISAYEAKAAEAEENRKEELVKNYENILSAEEIAPIKEAVKNFSYDELESKLAVTFSRKNLAGEAHKVPYAMPEEESDFAKLIKKYRK